MDTRPLSCNAPRELTINDGKHQRDGLLIFVKLSITLNAKLIFLMAEKEGIVFENICDVIYE